ncbi:DUF1467 family protein [Candidatus Raskinella chloraquaticus]|uniref:DUF1467 domain-containing protein n=1 Tax=Candidatus Raskinella chloraquaticus TaxID=1951219 RepID=A0A1W9HVU5_9HYPH|nr:MAG: hypothetical protein A4S15_11030 [Proteobacteria bacterium SG_bin8]
MSWRIALGLYLVIWWTILFAVLPFGVRSQAEDGAVVPGSEAAAPIRPLLLRKAMITSVLAAIILFVVWLAIHFRIFAS